MGSLYSEYTSWLHAWSAGRKLLLMALLGTGLFLIDSPWLLAMAGAACGLLWLSLGRATEGARRLDKAGSRENQHGRIVLIASITAFEPSPGLVAYAASKAGVVQAGRTLAREWARAGINVNTVSPGYIRTAINDAWFDTEPGKKQIAKFLETTTFGPKRSEIDAIG